MTNEEMKELQVEQLENVAGGAGIIDTAIQTLEDLEQSDVFGQVKSLLQLAKMMCSDKVTLVNTIKTLAGGAGINFDDGVVEDFVDKYYDLL